MKRSFSLWLVVAGTSLIAATYGLVRLAYGLHLPAMQTDLGFDATLAGGISAGSSVAYCAAALAGFALAPRRPRQLVVLAGGTAALGSAGMAVAMSPSFLALSTVIASMGAGFASPALVRIVQRGLECASDERASRGRSGAAQTLVNAGTGPGLVAAGLIAAVLLPQWRAAWWIAAAATVVAAVSVLALDRARSIGSAAGLPPRSWYGAHRWVIVAALLMGAASAAVWTFARAMLAEGGQSETITVFAWVALGVGGVVVMPTAGPMTRLQPGRAWALTVAATAAATLVVVVSSAVPAVTILACVVFGWGYTGATGALIAWTTALDRERASSGTAMLFVLLVLGQAVGAAALGATVAGAGHVVAFAVAAGVALGAAVLGFVPRSQPAMPSSLPGIEASSRRV